MRIAVEVLVPLRLFVYRFLSERRRSLLLALAVVAHLNLKFFKKIRKKVLTFAFGGVIITKLSARATAHEFF